MTMDKTTVDKFCTLAGLLAQAMNKTSGAASKFDPRVAKLTATEKRAMLQLGMGLEYFLL